VRFIPPKTLPSPSNTGGICCGDTPKKPRHILLTQKDAERIATHTKQEIKSFTEVAVNSEPYIFELKKNRETGKCIYHQNNQCSIYLERPLICRFYPFQLTTDAAGIFVFTETSECQQIQPCTQKTGKLNQTYFKRLFQQAQNELCKA
jgi:Fe-S-cluster containining protein